MSIVHIWTNGPNTFLGEEYPMPKKEYFFRHITISCQNLHFIMSGICLELGFSIYCRVPPTRGLQVMMAWGHKWRANKCARTARWLMLPTCWLFSYKENTQQDLFNLNWIFLPYIVPTELTAIKHRVATSVMFISQPPIQHPNFDKPRSLS